ncbi:hypothetical protein AAE478_010027 [Parahypoxylon ruwenzoriense]
MSALSSESPFTIVLTVEYRIGLRHPDTPKRYHATNLTIWLAGAVKFYEQLHSEKRARFMYESGYPEMIMQLAREKENQVDQLRDTLKIQNGSFFRENGKYSHVAEHKDPDVPALDRAFEDVEIQLPRLPDLSPGQSLLRERDLFRGEVERFRRIWDPGKDQEAG